MRRNQPASHQSGPGPHHHTHPCMLDVGEKRPLNPASTTESILNSPMDPGTVARQTEQGDCDRPPAKQDLTKSLASGCASALTTSLVYMPKLGDLLSLLPRTSDESRPTEDPVEIPEM